jgi:hypothetical protein
VGAAVPPQDARSPASPFAPPHDRLPARRVTSCAPSCVPPGGTVMFFATCDVPSCFAACGRLAQPGGDRPRWQNPSFRNTALEQASPSSRAWTKSRTPRNGSSTAFKDAGTHLARHDWQPFFGEPQFASTSGTDGGPRPKPRAPQSFDEINFLILAQIDACRIGARSIGVGAMEVEHTGLFGRDGHRKFFARSEIGDNCLW